MSTVESAATTERTELLAALAKHRQLFRVTLRDLTTEQAARRTTVSELCLGGLVKHVTQAEENWTNFIVRGTSAIPDFDEMTEDDFARRADEFRMLDGETLETILARYDEIARRTETVVNELPTLDVSHPLPVASWFEEGSWSARRVLLHLIAETAQHAGHADIIREALDGAKTMG